MSLPTRVIDRLFERLIATYGREFAARYEGIDTEAVKAAWAHELSGFAARLPDIAWALENLPERCPNAIEFRNLCRTAPAQNTPRLPEPPADPERVRAELAKLQAVRGGNAERDPKDWARVVLQRIERGERVLSYTRRSARAALGLQAV